MSKAFLLTRQSIDTPQGIRLELWFSTDNGPIRLHIDQQRQVFFITQADAQQAEKTLSSHPELWQQCEIKALQLKDFSLRPMAAVYCNSMQAFYRVRDVLQQCAVSGYESDIRPAERYLSERFITGPVEIYNPDQSRHLSNMPIKPTVYEPRLKPLSLDIETAYDSSELYSIAYICEHHHEVLMIGNPAASRPDINITYVKNETQLLRTFLQRVNQLDPDVLIGWNVINFDLRFLQRKADELKIRLGLGRNQQVIRWRQSQGDSQHYFIFIPGRVVLDGIDTLKSATWNFDSFALDFVANQLLKRGKLIQHQHDDPLYKAREIKRQFYEDKLSLARYNLEDCQLVIDIFNKAELIHFAIERARLTGLEMDRLGGSVAAFDNLYLPRLHRKGYTAPNIGDYGQGNTAPGGYVMDSKPGLYESVLVLDYKSLYPSIIRTFRVDPYARIAAKNLPVEQTIEGYDGASFAKDEHILPHIIAELWQARDKAKQEKNNALSQAIKIIMNSFYGVLGTPGCRVHDARLTSSITKRSHDIIKQSVELIHQQGYEVIYGDTDSVFVATHQSLSQQQADKIGKQLCQVINKYWKHNLQQLHNIESFLEMEYETHFTRFFMPTIRGSDKGSKKRYAGLVNDDGIEKVIFKGLESVRTDWTALARHFQQQLYYMIFTGESYHEFIQDTVARLYAGDFDEQLIYRKRLRQSLHKYQKNIPPHARAAISAEKAFKEKGLPSRYQHKGWIEYLITQNGPETLECQSAKLDYEHYIEKQLTPIADSILYLFDETMEQILNRQIQLF